MRRVSYQGVLGGPPSGPGEGGVYVRLGPDTIGTRRKDARRDITVALSKAQGRWLRETVALSGPSIDEGAVLRVLVNLGMELEIDWPVIARGTALREAVRDSVMVRRRAPG